MSFICSSPRCAVSNSNENGFEQIGSSSMSCNLARYGWANASSTAFKEIPRYINHQIFILAEHVAKNILNTLLNFTSKCLDKINLINQIIIST